jgi:hypothetical protein
VQIENVARVSFASWWAAQQQRDFAIGNGMLGKVIIHNQSILPLSRKYSAIAQPA